MARRDSSPQHPTTCEACDAEIWFKLVDGPGPKPLLIPLRAQPDDAGTVAAAPGRAWQHGRFLAATEQPDEAKAEQRWKNHFDDCPRAEVFRRKKHDRQARTRAIREGEAAQLALPISP